MKSSKDPEFVTGKQNCRVENIMKMLAQVTEKTMKT